MARGRLRELHDIPWPFLGLGLYRAWLDGIIDILAQTDTVFFSSKFIFDVTCGLSALALALLLAPRARAGRDRVVIAATAAMVASSLGLGALSGDGAAIQPVHTLCCALGAFGMMSLSLLWIELYASLNPVRMALCYSMALLLGKAVVLLLAGYNDAYRLFFQLILPVLSGLLLYRSRQRVFGTSSTQEGVPPAITSFPWKPALFMGAYAFAYAFSGLSPTAGSSFLEFVGAVPAIAVLCSVLFSTGRFDFFSMYGMALPLMVCGFLLLAMVPGAPQWAVGGCVDMSYAAASMLVVLIVCGIAYRTGASALWLFGLVRFVQYTAMGAGQLSRQGLDSLTAASAVDVPLVPIVVIALVLVASIVFATERSSYFGWNIESIATQKGEKLVVPLSVKIEHVAEGYNLTQREQEVLLQLLHHKTVAAIGEDMFIAEGTVKAHIQHIYAKLGIHSRKELFALFNEG